MPPRRTLGRLGRASVSLLVLSIALVIAFTFVPPVASTVRTLALVPEMLQLPLRPLSTLVPQPTRETAAYGDPPDRLDIYLPAGARPDGRHPGLVLAFGVHPPPLDDPQIVDVARSIARLGVVVGVADSTQLRLTRVSVDEPAHLAEAVLVLSGRPEVDRARVGLAGFSAGASIALLAAADPRVAEGLRYVSAFGGYADAELLLVDVATRTMEVDGVVRAWPADAGVRRDVLELLLLTIEPADVRDSLREVLTPLVAAEPRGPPPADVPSFSGDALAAFRLFTAPDRAAADAALATISPEVRAELDAISPLSRAGAVRAPVYLMHGENDTAIPVSHAVVLREALPPSSLGRFTRFGRFEHGQPGAAGLGLEDVPDIWQLTLHLHSIVAAATE